MTLGFLCGRCHPLTVLLGGLSENIHNVLGVVNFYEGQHFNYLFLVNKLPKFSS